MNAEQLVDRLLGHLAVSVSPRLTNRLYQFGIGSARVLKRKTLTEKAKAHLADVTGPDGEIDLATLRQAVASGFEAAPKIPLADFGIEIDANDAEAFFASL